MDSLIRAVNYLKILRIVFKESKTDAPDVINVLIVS